VYWTRTAILIGLYRLRNILVAYAQYFRLTASNSQKKNDTWILRMNGFCQSLLELEIMWQIVWFSYSAQCSVGHFVTMNCTISVRFIRTHSAVRTQLGNSVAGPLTAPPVTTCTSAVLASAVRVPAAIGSTENAGSDCEGLDCTRRKKIDEDYIVTWKYLSQVGKRLFQIIHGQRHAITKA